MHPRWAWRKLRLQKVGWSRVQRESSGKKGDDSKIGQEKPWYVWWMVSRVFGGDTEGRDTWFPGYRASRGCAVSPLLIPSGWVLPCVLGIPKRSAFPSCLQRAHGWVVADRELKSDETIIG